MCSSNTSAEANIDDENKDVDCDDFEIGRLKDSLTIESTTNK